MATNNETMMEVRSKPLVSCLVIAFKQEQFIREAVEGVFAQTYSPMEIILSDDCSPDNTFEIMREMAENYRGPHRVILNKTTKNAGAAGNINASWALAAGEFIVIQAGDDVSLPCRVESLVKAWQASPAVDLVVSDVVVIDSDGVEVKKGWPDPVTAPLTLAEAVRDGRCYALGCALGYSRKLFSDYGPLDLSVIQEDWVLAFRALLGNGIRIVDEPLVKYRLHHNNAWFGQQGTKRALTRMQNRRVARNQLGLYRDWIRAWDKSGRSDGSERRRLVALERQCEYDVEGYDCGRIGAIAVAFRAFRDGLPIRKVLGLIKRHVFRFLA